MKIIVVGAGHAGIEAAYAAAKMKAQTVLITIHLESIGQMSCNPSIGGIAKGHLVKEIDVMGGAMARAADETGIQFRILNRSKGPAVRATRTQNDKTAYRHYMKNFLETIEGLQIYQSMVSEIVLKGGKVKGVRLLEGDVIEGDAVILTPGTFLNGQIYIGDVIYPAGRSNEPASVELGNNLKKMGFQTCRLKTGTPMRIHSDSIDWDRFVPQPGDDPPMPFSLFTKKKVKNRVLCYLGHTPPVVRRIIQDNLHRSPLYSGKIEGIGPRYCPSIEDKIVKFPKRESHHIYLEPEGIDNKEVYVNGLSSSLPVDIQKQILSAIPGLERSVIMRPAYAIEYDAVSSLQLKHSLECQMVENLFFAGQINGTSGYEEAAAQGLMAGINSVLKLRGEEPLILGREEGYIGVMIDDIVTKGVDEPYRLFTSRAEYRLQMREDNAFERLGKYGYDLGLLNKRHFRSQKRILGYRHGIIDHMKGKTVVHRKKRYSLFDLLKIPEISFEKMEEIYGQPVAASPSMADVSYIEANIKYDGYIQIQKQHLERFKKLEKTLIPDDIDYDEVDGLSTEVRQKLSLHRPGHLGEALKIPGVTPASINAISIYLAVRNRIVRKK